MLEVVIGGQSRWWWVGGRAGGWWWWQRVAGAGIDMVMVVKRVIVGCWWSDYSKFTSRHSKKRVGGASGGSGEGWRPKYWRALVAWRMLALVVVVRAARSPLLPTLVVVSGGAGCIRATMGYPGALEAADGKKVAVAVAGVERWWVLRTNQ